MKNTFSDWFSDLSFHDDDAYIENRLNAVNALIDTATRQTFELLVRIAFRIKLQMDTIEIAELREKFVGSQLPPGDEELVRLATAALCIAVTQNDKVSILVATLVASTACGGLRTLSSPIDLIGISKNSINQSANNARRRPSLSAVKPPRLGLDRTEVDAALKLANEGEPSAAIRTLVGSINKLVGDVIRRQSTIETNFQLYVTIQDEELDILWWLQCGRSNTLDLAFGEIPDLQRPLAVAIELGKMTTVLPGPPSLATLLTKAEIRDSGPLALRTAIQSMPLPWINVALAEIQTSKISQYSTPILYALCRCQEIEGNGAWLPAWASLTGLPESSELTPLQLAEATYLEYSLAKLG